MSSAIETLGALHLAVERRHERTSALQHFDGERWQATPDWRFHRHIVRLALYLHERVKVGTGDHVLLLAPLSREWMVVDWAAVTQGAVTVVLDPGLSDAALAAASEQFAPVAAFVAGPEELRRVRALGSMAESIRSLVLFDADAAPDREGAVISYDQVLELGGTLDTAERAGAYRDRARGLAPVDRATVHARPGSNGSPSWEVLTHVETVTRWRQHEAVGAPRHGDIAYVHRDALTARAHVALYGLLGDGLTSTAIAPPGSEHDQIERLGPRKVVARSGVVDRKAHSEPVRTMGRARRWLDRVRRNRGGSP